MDKLLITWTDEYSVDFDKIDEQHKVLVDLINKLYDAFLKADAKNIISEILDEMLKYTAYHFKTEEDLFEKHNYPDIDKHKNEHLAFVNKTKSFIEMFEKEDIYLTYDVMNFLRGWLLAHIKVSDKEYSRYLKTQGVSDI